MKRLTNKRILLGVTGGIAAYKSADLVRRLRESGAEIQVVMTRAAKEFVTPLTFQALSGKPVCLELLDPVAESGMGHIALARWADANVIAPASADFIARLAHGRADDLLSAVCLASNADLAVAPAMNLRMWENAATRENVALLKRRGIRLWGPAEGEQACGETGYGRMLEPAQITRMIAGLFESGRLKGVRVLVTAGPTQEEIDPVRFITNHSSGKMGYALAEAAAEAGARVTLVSGPVSITPPGRIKFMAVRSAEQMRNQVMTLAPACDIFISVAAVADYRPAQRSENKVKKRNAGLVLELERTPDIVAEVAALPGGPFTVGFAAETEDLEANALAKLKEKSLDMIAANRVGQPAGGFASDENALRVLWESGHADLPSTPKTKLARQFISIITERYHAKNPAQDS